MIFARSLMDTIVASALSNLSDRSEWVNSAHNDSSDRSEWGFGLFRQQRSGRQQGVQRHSVCDEERQNLQIVERAEWDKGSQLLQESRRLG